MLDFGIEDGDIVLIEMNGKVVDGDRVVVILDDMAVIKKLYFANDTIILYPESKNKDYKPIILSKDFKIFGKVQKIIKMPKIKDGEELIYERVE